MKKITCAILSLTLLSACASYDADMDRSEARRARHRAHIQEEQGCRGLDEHAAYRQCAIDTFYRTHQTPYTMSTLPGGRPLVIIKRSNGNIIETKQTIVTKTVETSDPVIQEPTGVAPVFDETVLIKERPQPALYIMETTSPRETIVIEEKAVKPVKAPTWWENYQTTKKTDAGDAPKCPCADPNAPCPQCTLK